VDLLVRDACVVTMDADRRVHADGAVAIDGERIVAVGATADLARRYAPRRTIAAAGAVVTPGLVNAHQHVTGDLLARGLIPDRLDHHTIIGTWFYPLHLAETRRDEGLSALLACAEMLRYGTTAFLESGTAWYPGALAGAVERAGILGVVGKRVWDLPREPRRFRLTTGQALRALDQAVRTVRQRSSGNARPAITLVGHATASDALLVGASDLARAHGLRLAMHLAPVEADVQAFLRRSGRRPVEHLAALGVLGPHVTLVHLVHVSDREIDLLAEHGVSVVACPLTAARLGYGFGRVGKHPEMLARGVNLALGADNASAANTLDLLKLAFLLAGLYVDGRQDAGVLGAARLFELLTLGGARALGLADEIGSLEAGKRADLVVWRRDGPEWQPRWDPVQALVHATDGRSVDRVVVRGRVVVERGRLTTLSERALYRRVATAAPALVARAGLPALLAAMAELPETSGGRA
jgi:cytosine/adenosine deaminase-related metal-dependent hydrolase